MVLIYTPAISPRLSYSCSFLLGELLQVEYAFTSDTAAFQQIPGIKINYSGEKMENCRMQITPANTLLSEEGVRPQSITCFEVSSYKAFFKTTGDFSFDIFAAAFYLLSRYEEYLSHTKDKYGRYAHENALAFTEGFLHQPLIHIWAADFAKVLRQQYPDFSFEFPAFCFVPTYDIDIAFSFLHKGMIRTIGSALRSLLSMDTASLAERIKVLMNRKKDPFDNFEWLNEMHRHYQLDPVYFFLVAEKKSLYDRNISPHNAALQHLIRKHAAQYTIGIHPSWQSGQRFSILKRETALLEKITGKEIHASRYHYIRFNFPEGYRRLIQAGISHDYSMGYGSINGFRASVAVPFYWYDLEQEEQTTLRIHPFCYMEATSYHQQKQSAAEALEELLYYYKVCKKNNGTFISIWHNHTLGNDPLYEGWKEIYETFLHHINA